MGEPMPPPVPPPVKGGGGNNCLLYGCIGAAFLVVLLVAAGVLASVIGLRSFADQFTQAEPRRLPAITMPEELYAPIAENYDAFVTAARASESATIILNAEAINALIANHHDFREAQDHVFVRIDGDVIGGDISIQFPPEMPLIGGRYLNGSATFRLEIVSGRPSLFFETIEVAGQTPPDEILHDLRRQNLLQNAYQDPQFAQVLSRIDSVQVADGTIAIATR